MKNLPSIYVQREKYPFLPDDVFMPIEAPIVPKEISGRYGVNKKGNVKNLKTGRLLKPSKDLSGYLIISFKSVKIIKYRVHRLVAQVFLCNIINNILKPVVNHINHIRDDNHISNLEWVSRDDNLRTDKVTPRNEKYLGDYVGYNNKGEEVERFNVRNIPEKYTYESLRTATNKSKNYPKYKGLSWRLERPVREIHGFSGNLNDYKWYKHWKYENVYVCEEGFIKVNNKISYYCDEINSRGYVQVSIKQKSYPAHRIIMEYLVNRDLELWEYVDHINSVKHDNSFKNLRLTDAAGNLQNINTLKLLSNDITVCNFYGDFLFRSHTREVYKFIFGDRKINYMSNNFLDCNINNKKFITFLTGDINTLYKKLKSILFVVSEDMTKIFGAFKKLEDIKDSKLINRNWSTLQRHYHNKTIIDGYYILNGNEDIIKLLKKQKHLTVLDSENNQPLDI